MPRTTFTHVPLSTEALFGRRALTRLGDMLAGQFRMAGLMAVPPSPIWADEPIDSETSKALEGLSDGLPAPSISWQASDRYAAPVEPLQIRLLRRHDGIGAAPKAILLPTDGEDLGVLLNKSRSFGLPIANPATGTKGVLAFLARNMTLTDESDAANGILTFAPGVSWQKLKGIADRHHLALPSGLSDRFESPFRAATAGLFKTVHFETLEAHPVSVTVELPPKRRGWLDAIWLFKDHAAAIEAMHQILRDVPPLYAGLISDIELKTGEALGFWRVGVPFLGRQAFTGLRLAYQGGLLVSRAKLMEAGFITGRFGGRDWRAGPMLGRSRQLEALYYCGGGLAGIDQPMDHFNPYDPIAATLGDTAGELTQFPGATPVTATTYIKTAHGPLIRRSRVHYARDLAKGVAETLAIHAAGRTSPLPSSPPPDKAQPQPDPEATSQTQEWQAIRDVLMAQVHDRPAENLPKKVSAPKKLQY